MKKNLWDVWKEKDGSKSYWLVQFPKGRMDFRTKKEAVNVSIMMKKTHNN